MDHPKLRPIDAFPVHVDGREVICLRDPTGLSEGTLFVPRQALIILAQCDGKHSILDMQEAYARQFGEILFSDTIKALIDQLDEQLLLDSERFQTYRQQVSDEFRRSPTRHAAHAGQAYEADAYQLEAQLASYFAHPEGPGRTAAGADERMVRGILAPHIDPRRGGPCFAWA